jgi:ferredoxin
VLPEAEQVIVAARPCDAAAIEILDHLFNWDSQDASFNHRRRLTTIVSLACTAHDRHCFCTSVGSGPVDERGSDAMLVDLGDGAYELRPLSDKGSLLFCGRTEASDRAGTITPGPEPSIDRQAIEQFLTDGFENPAWPAASLRCLGCGACAYTCPTCHCFDIVDEGAGGSGIRARNWDACQFPMFTMHASGHNPRSGQAQRQRQRIFHKFKIYPDKFGETLCTGCGNCTRNCPVSLGVRPVLEKLSMCAKTTLAKS